MSIAFNNFNALGGGATLLHIAAGLGLGPLAAANSAVPIGGVPAWPVPAALAARLGDIANRWRLGLTEANQRVLIDEFIYEVLFGPAGFTPAMPPALHVTAERNVAVGGVAGAVAPGGQIGHGRFDYLVSGNAFAVNFIPSVVIEAKLNLGAGMDFGQEQLMAQMATTRQIGFVVRNYLRGILSNGRFWRFYEFDVPGNIIRRTNPVLDATVAGQQTHIAQLIRDFFCSYNAAFQIL